MLIQTVSIDCKFTMKVLSKTDADVQNFLFLSADLLSILLSIILASKG